MDKAYQVIIGMIWNLHQRGNLIDMIEIINIYIAIPNF